MPTIEEDWEAEADPNPKLRGYRGPTKADFARQRKERKERLKTVNVRYKVFTQVQETQQTLSELPLLKEPTSSKETLPNSDDKNLTKDHF